MKLYTEDQLKNALDEICISRDIDIFDELESVIPIELPSDEEIVQASEATYREHPSNPKDHPEWKYNQDINAPRKRKAFIKGAKWVLEQIKQQAE